MPTREVLRYAIRQIRALTPQVEIIAPQHGHVITGDLVPLFLERLHELLVGHDLLEEELEARLADDYRELMNQLLDAALMVLGEDELAARLADDFVDDGLDQHLAAVATGWEPRANGYAGTTKVFARLTQHEEESFVTDLRNRVLKFCSERHIPVPPIGWGV
jgi:hypothetical protein